jgi:hypothetical protein
MQNATDAFRPSPACPHCGISMRFVRSFPNFGASAPLLTFDYIMCGLSVTEAADAVELAGKAAA